MAAFSSTAFSTSAFSDGAFSFPAASPAVVVQEEAADSGGSRKKKVRGPYSDPRIFDEYIKRCIAEREAPRENVEKAVLQEALVDAVQERKDTNAEEIGALLSENRLLERLLTLEKAKRNIRALEARRQVLAKQVENMQDEEEQTILTLFEAL